jgi:hypothetical protein
VSKKEQIKKVYRITDAYGVVLGFQVATNEDEAVSLAKTYYRLKSAARAEFVRDDTI